MAFQFRGEQKCTGCGCTYEWVTTQKEKGDFVIGLMDLTCKNVKRCTRVNQTNLYNIEIGCPECGKRELIKEEK